MHPHCASEDTVILECTRLYLDWQSMGGVQAQDYASGAALQQPHNQQALLVLIYIELCKGNCSGALNLLKQQQVPAK